MRLDVTRVLNNQLFLDTIDVIRTHSGFDSNGLQVLVPTTYTNIVAVVTQKNGDILRRDAAGERIEGSIAVYTKFLLTNGRDQSSDLTADVIVYPAGTGNQYTVSMLNDYARWGPGWVSAVCDLLPTIPNDQPF